MSKAKEIFDLRTKSTSWTCSKCGKEQAPQLAKAVFEPWGDSYRVARWECLPCNAPKAKGRYGKRR